MIGRIVEFYSIFLMYLAAKMSANCPDIPFFNKYDLVYSRDEIPVTWDA